MEEYKNLEEIKYQKIIRNKQIEDDIYHNEVLMAQYEERISEIKAIENLINRNKELEKQIDLEYVEENYIEKSKVIPKSKVKEKIEELKEKMKSENNEKVIIWLHKQIRILQELLEE